MHQRTATAKLGWSERLFIATSFLGFAATALASTFMAVHFW
jgi:hypothetical protein